jgi:HAD superfamily hydrolase (TIGR01490 family)
MTGSLAPVASPRVAAFFDFDRTIVNTDGGVLFGKELMRIYDRRIRDDRPGTIGWFYRVATWRLRIVRLLATGLIARLFYYAKIIKRSVLVNIAYGGLKGLSIDELRLLARDFVDEFLIERAYPQALERMRWHHDQGHLVIIATTNMKLLVEHLKTHVPVDGVIGADLIAKDGRATGKVVGPTYGAQKAVAIREYAHAHNISLPRSYAYTDHYSDHFILPLVGHPHVVNPRRRLRRMAKKRRWTILEFHEPPARKRGNRVGCLSRSVQFKRRAPRPPHRPCSTRWRSSSRPTS